MPYDPETGVGIVHVDATSADGRVVTRREWSCSCGESGSGERVGDDSSAVAAAWAACHEHVKVCPNAKARPWEVAIKDHVDV